MVKNANCHGRVDCDGRTDSEKRALALYEAGVRMPDETFPD